MSPSETGTTDHPLGDFADAVADAVGGTAEITFDTIKIRVDPANWAAAHRTAREEHNLVFFSWLSGVDWSNEVAAGDPLTEEVTERFEVLSTVSDVTEGKRVTFSTDLAKENPRIDSLVEVYAGANWHERETAEMLGVTFVGHPDPTNIYLPDSFIGNPLRKSYPLLSREVKPWPGTVDVEAMPGSSSDESGDPSEENPEA